MQKYFILTGVCIMLILGIVLFKEYHTGNIVQAQVGGVSSFQMTVPRKDAPGQLPITRVVATVNLTATVPMTAPVTFNITDTNDQLHVFTVAAGGISVTRIYTPTGGLASDVVTVDPPDSTDPQDPLSRRYLIRFNLNSDSTDTCNNTMAAASETWTVTLSAAADPPDISSVCLRSFDRNIPGAACTTTQPVQDGIFATVTSSSGPAQTCDIFRPGLDVMMVLDKSGSMSGQTLGSASRPKIEALRDAVEDFTRLWADLRTVEEQAVTDDLIDEVPLDRIGVVLFDSTADWWAPVSSPATPLVTFTNALTPTIINNTNTITPGGATSMGDGLELADGALPPDPDRRKVILLMSNGWQNTSPLVGVEPLPNPTNVFTQTSSSGPTFSLANQAGYDIYSVTVGTSTAVEPTINQNLARATGGFYINTEDDAEQLRLFFLELLENFLRFNTWQTALLASGSLDDEETFSTQIPVSSTTTNLAVNLLWAETPYPYYSSFRLRIFPPGSTEPLEAFSSSGSIRLVVDTTEYGPGNWTVEVYYSFGVSLQPVPFKLIALVDDTGVNVDMEIVEGDYTPGEPIRLEARITEFGEPVLGVGTFSGDKMFAQVVKPGESIGDLLAQSSASFDPPTQDDPASNADARLFNELQQNPDALVRVQDRIVLRDNGSGGDEVANDGIYTALYTSDEPGHYNFLFSVQGRARETGFFARQQIRTAYVRPVPDTENTEVDTSVQGSGSQQSLLVSLTPRTASGSLMPAFGNYFWARLVRGGQAFKFVDPDLDGVYTTTIPFQGDEPPSISIHFLDVAQIIGDEVTADELPVPLSRGNTVVSVGDTFTYLPLILR